MGLHQIGAGPCHFGAVSGKPADSGAKAEPETAVAVTPCNCACLAGTANEGHKRVERETGIEPATFSLGS